MELNYVYLASVLNSVIRMTTPILLASLTAAICSKIKLLNIGMEGLMIAGAFTSIVVNYYTQSVTLAVLSSILIGIILSSLMAFCILDLKASSVVVGLALNAMMAGTTSYLLTIFFGVKGIFTHSKLLPLPKINIGSLSNIPVISKIFDNLTMIDYLALICAILIYIFLYKTVLGYRLRAIGVNLESARSLGIPVKSYQFITYSLSGALSGLAGCALSMGSVTLFIDNISSGRGYIALAANNLGLSHPLGVLASSAFFGMWQAFGNTLQNTSLKTQVTSSIPYLATILALVLYSVINEVKRRKVS